MKVLTVIGTRPEAIKLAPVVAALERRAPEVSSVVCATAQHRELLDQVLDVFHLRCDYDLDVMTADQQLAATTARILERLDEVVAKEQPDWLLAQGDTTTVLAVSLVAHYRRTRMGHVEAGLRTGDKWQPFPEEMNRRLSDVLADLHFAPTPASRDNLLREGVAGASILVTGNTVVDAVQAIAARLRSDPVTAPPGREQRRTILVTVHRRENHGATLEGICDGLATVAAAFRDTVRIVYPVHPNPHVRSVVHGRLQDVANIELVEPLRYTDCVRLLMESYLVLTDSGGLQEEAPSLGVPVLVVRNVTERPEGVEAGAAELVGTDPADIAAAVGSLLEDAARHRRMAAAANPYGDGRASERIVAALSGRLPPIPR